MSTTRSTSRFLVLIAAIALAATGCSASMATSTPTPSGTPQEHHAGSTLTVTPEMAVTKTDKDPSLKLTAPDNTGHRSLTCADPHALSMRGPLGAKTGTSRQGEFDFETDPGFTWDYNDPAMNKQQHLTLTFVGSDADVYLPATMIVSAFSRHDQAPKVRWQHDTVIDLRHHSMHGKSRITLNTRDFIAPGTGYIGLPVMCLTPSITPDPATTDADTPRAK